MVRLLSVVMFVLMSMPAMANEEGAKKFVTGLADGVVGILQDKSISESNKTSQLQALLKKSVDIPWVARFVLGGHWRKADDSQKTQYLTNYEAFIIKSYTKRLSQYAGQTYKVRSTRALQDAGEYSLVMELITPNEPNVIIDYRLREEAGSYKIYDIIVEGVSLITTQRSEFNSVVSRQGLDALIDALAKKTAQAGA